MEVLPLEPPDFLPLYERVDEWFGRQVHEELHPVFFHHFGGYSVREGEELVGFLLGLRSQRNRDVAYIHLVGIHPDHRGKGIGTHLYERFERQARVWGCDVIEAVTVPEDHSARSFHTGKGFREELVEDWAGEGRPRVRLRKRLGPVGF